MWNVNEGNEGRLQTEDRLEENRLPILRRDRAKEKEDVIAFVGRGVEFKGVITYSGTVRIDGRVEGEIHTDGELVIGEDAVLAAKITAGTVISCGKITGDIIATTRVHLNAPAALHGSVTAPLLAIEEGVVFTGTLTMTRADQEATEAGQPNLPSPLRLNSRNKAANA